MSSWIQTYFTRLPAALMPQILAAASERTQEELAGSEFWNPFLEKYRQQVKKRRDELSAEIAQQAQKIFFHPHNSELKVELASLYQKASRELEDLKKDSSLGLPVVEIIPQTNYRLTKLTGDTGLFWTIKTYSYEQFRPLASEPATLRAQVHAQQLFLCPLGLELLTVAPLGT